MLPLGKRDRARQLLSQEAGADETLLTTGPNVLRVYEKLRQSLSALAGVAGFRSLASRALILAKAEDPSLGTMQVASDGSLQVLNKDLESDKLPAGESGVILLSQFLGLLHAFIGEALTLRLLRDAWPNAVLDDCDSEDGEKHELTR
jgi:hypothetical protein